MTTTRARDVSNYDRGGAPGVTSCPGGYVIIPSNDSVRLRASLGALLAAEPGITVIVVDDGLSARPGDARVQYIDGVKPFIFARNVNRGIERAMAAGASDVFLLNDDALLATPGGLTVMAAQARRAGLAACVPRTDCGHPAQASVFNGIRIVAHPVPFVCVWLARETIECVGLLDERFTEYGYDDNDYLYRIKLAGGKWGICGDVFVRHRALPSAFRGRPGAAISVARGAEIFKRKWGHIW